MGKRLRCLAMLLLTIWLSACGGDDDSVSHASPSGTCPAKGDIDLS